MLAKETECNIKFCLSAGKEVYLKRDNLKFEEATGILTNSSLHLPALVAGGSYKGSNSALVKRLIAGTKYTSVWVGEFI